MRPQNGRLKTICVVIDRFRRDQSGNYMVILGLLMPALIGLVGLGTDYGLWTYTQQLMQTATDTSAVSAAYAYLNGGGTSITTQANAVASSYGFVNGTDNVGVTVNRPPQSGSYTTNPNAVEVIINQAKSPLFSTLFLRNPVPITARSVAVGTNNGKGCVLSLNRHASGATIGQGSTTVNLNNCSLYDNSDSSSALTVGGSANINALSVSVVGGISGQAGITTTQGVQQNTGNPITDPYADVAVPSTAGAPNITSCGGNGNCGSGTLQPGIYANGMKFTGGATATLMPGVYFIEGNGLDVASGATLTGTGVTLVFTSANGSYPSTMATINGNATVNLTAPTTGPLAGIALFGDRSMPTSTMFKFNGGGSENFTGAIYVPNGAVQYAGGANNPNGCTQLVADTVTFTGNSNFAIDCSGKGTKPLGAAAVALVE